MKKLINITGSVLFVLMLSMNLYFSDVDKNLDITVNNEITEAQAQLQLPPYTCYQVTHNCWFWNCYTVIHCGGCAGVSTDQWTEPAYCGGGGAL
jgi:hypothetical protein